MEKQRRDEALPVAARRKLVMRLSNLMRPGETGRRGAVLVLLAVITEGSAGVR
ncbi:MAG: hypothetical protein ACT6RN_14860 [Agrobacterium sp.]|uniref:hypothetical protein n=1 Tax=Agrobacterium sp. TaxID=361 RepID=UPI00403843AC